MGQQVALLNSVTKNILTCEFYECRVVGWPWRNPKRRSIVMVCIVDERATNTLQQCYVPPTREHRRRKVLIRDPHGWAAPKSCARHGRRGAARGGASG